MDEQLKAEAVEAARKAKVAVLFVGLPESFETEGLDRKHMRLPLCQNDLIDAVCAVQPNTVVVLHNGSPVEMPWVDRVKGILEAYLGGQAVGFATVNLLFGKANPCGRLPETFPIKLEDNPSYLYFKGEGGKVEYREGVFVGYRYYETKKMEVLFPFGHGLSYTKFEYSNLRLNKASMKDTDLLTVSVDGQNTGKITGKEVVQLYVSPKGGEIIRPIKELREFEKVELMPGETKTVTFTLNKRAFAYWNTKIHDWQVETGTYEVTIGRSVRDIVETKEIRLESTVQIPTLYTMNSTIGEMMQNPKAMSIMGEFMSNMAKIPEGMEDTTNGVMSAEAMQAAMVESSPRMIINFMPDIKREDFQKLLDALNQ